MGCFHYTGEGQHGDREMKSGNAAIVNHRQERRILRLFQGVRGVVEYLGEFQLDAEKPFYNTDASEANDGPVRSVIVFRLQPTNGQARPENVDAILPSVDRVERVPVEEQYTERFFVEPGREPYEAERREGKLVRAFCDYLESSGHRVQRLQVVPQGEAKPIFPDLYVPEIPILIEAKGSVARDSIRMALGQLID